MIDPTYDSRDEPEDLIEQQVRRAARQHGLLKDPLQPGPPPAYGPGPGRARRRWGRGPLIGVTLLALAFAGERTGVIHPDVFERFTTPTSDWETIYALREVTVRANAGTDYVVKRKLDPGERVQVHRGDRSGWVLLYAGDGRPIGYAYRTRASFGAHPPPAPPASLAQPLLGSVGRVPSVPTPPPAPGDTTAVCSDGAPSFSRHASGTCSGHGGVRCWLHHPGPSPTTSSPLCTSISRSRE